MIFSRRLHSRPCLYQQSKSKLILRGAFYLLLIVAVTGCSLYAIDWNIHISFKSWLKFRGSSTNNASSFSSSPSLPYSSCLQYPYSAPKKESPPLTPGVPLKRLDECLGFAKSINIVNNHSQQQGDSVWFHTYWKDASQVDSEMTAQLLSMLRSFSATQSGLHYPKMKIWVRDEHQETFLIHSDAWHLAKQQMELQNQELTYGVWTKMPASMSAKEQDWNNMDYIGLLVLQQHGGVWFHPSTVFLRDWSVLIGKREWMIQHDCEATHTGHESLIDNGLQQRTMMHFFANSTLLCQLIESASNSNGRNAKGIMNLGRVYKAVYRSMIQNSIRPWALLPWCFMNLADGCSLVNTNAFHLFEKPKNDGDAASEISKSGIFALQYDPNQWNDEPGTLVYLLDQDYRIKTGW